MSAVVDLHVCRKHVGHPADFAPAHGIGLARQGKRPHAGPAETPREQVTIDDAVDLVRAGGRLVYSLREGSDDARGRREQLIELGELPRIDSARLRDCCLVIRRTSRRLQRDFQSGGMSVDESDVRSTVPAQIGEQPIEQPHIRS